MDWGGGVRGDMVRRSDDRPKNDSNVSIVVFIAMVVVCIVLVVFVPLYGLAYGDLVNATNLANAAAQRAIQEAAAARKVKKEFLELMKGGE